MKRFAATRPTGLGAGLILALLLGHFASPSTADAGCGDHLVAVRVVDGDAADAPPPPAPIPCHGPNCSRQEEQPPLAPASVKVTLPDLKARLIELPDAPAADRPCWLRGDDPSCIVRVPDPIFHPPR